MEFELSPQDTLYSVGSILEKTAPRLETSLSHSGHKCPTGISDYFPETESLPGATK